MEALNKYTKEFENQHKMLRKYKKEHKDTINLAAKTRDKIKEKANKRRQDIKDAAEKQRQKVNDKLKELTGYTYQQYNDRAIKGHNKKTVKNTTEMNCKMECNKEKWCKGFEFNKKGKYCNLDTIGPKAKGWETNKKYNYFERKEKEKEHLVIDEESEDHEDDDEPKKKTMGTSFLTMLSYVFGIFIVAFCSFFALSISMNCTANSSLLWKIISNVFAFTSGVVYLIYYFVVRVLILQKPCKMDKVKFFC